MKYAISFISLLLAFQPGFAKENPEITLEKIWLQYTFHPKHPQGLESMKDGEHYLVLESGNDIQQLNRYSYKTGKKVSTLFTNDLKDTGGKPIKISSFEISEDENRLLLAVNTESIYRHSSRSNYYITDLKNPSYKILEEKLQLARFSPDGKRVSYVKDNNLYVYNIAGKTTAQITKDGVRNKIINGSPDWVYEEEFALVKAYEWSPDSRYIAYYRFDESGVREFSFPQYNGLYPENYVYKYPKVGEDNSVVSIHVYDLLEGKQIPIKVQGDYEYIARIHWTNSPGILALQVLNRAQNQFRLQFADVETGTAISMVKEESDTYVEVEDITFLKESQAFIRMSEKDGFYQPYYYEYKVQKENIDQPYIVEAPVSLAEKSRVVSKYIGFNEKNMTAYYEAVKKGEPHRREVIAYSLKSQKGGVLPFPEGVGHVAPSSNFSYFIKTTSRSFEPPKFTLHDGGGKLVRTIEDNQSLKDTLNQYNISQKEFFTMENRTGTTLHGWMIKPPDFDPKKTYPTLMFVYGGPGSQTVMDYWGGFNDMWYQMLVRKGYIIVSVDNRGTGARGREFKNCTYGKLGKLETEDQIDAAKWLGKQSYIDAQRIGIWGWSYGGYMSTLCLAKGAEFFKMAMAVAPVSNWKYYDTIYTERYMGLLKDNGQSYDDNSPINHVEKIKGKYLLVHGTADDNVHFQNTTELINALVDNDIQFDLGVYPNRNHGIYGGNTRYHLYKKMTNFILESL